MSEVALLEEMDRPEAEPFVAETPEPVIETAPEPEKTPEPETKAVEKSAEAEKPAPATKEPERVPLAVLMAERARHDAERKALEERLAKASEARPASKEPVPEIDYTQDPKGYVDSQVKRALHELDQLKKEGTETFSQTREQVADIQLTTAINAAEAAIVAEAPDYQEALAYVRNVRIQQLQLINPEATPEQLLAHLSQEERQMASAELARKRNPYKLLYQVAKTFGYTPPAAKPAAPVAPSAPAKPNGSTPTLSPDLTLGKTGGSAPDTAQADEGEGEDDILATAFSERFGRKRA